MTPLEREIARQRARLDRVEANGAGRIVRSYRAVEARLREDMDLLGQRIESAREAGVEVRPNWLRQEERYTTLLVQLQEHTLAFLHDALGAIEGTQREAIAGARDGAHRLTVAAMGAAPREAVAEVLSSFNRLPTVALDDLVGRAGRGPLRQLLEEITPGTAQLVADKLAYGVATGAPVRDIAREVAKAGEMPLVRALAITRTETLRSLRTASFRSYRQMGRVVQRWVWYAALDDRTCALCYAMHGTVHPMSEAMDTHVNCRCTPVPETLSWRALGFNVPDGRPRIPSGEAVFANLAAREQLAILGPARYEAYEAGELSLADLVRTTNSQRWGRGIRQANLAELGIA